MRIQVNRSRCARGETPHSARDLLGLHTQHDSMRTVGNGGKTAKKAVPILIEELETEGRRNKLC